MKYHVCGFLALLIVAGMLTAQTGDKTAGPGDGELDKKLEAIRQQMRKLQQEERDLLEKQAERERTKQAAKLKEEELKRKAEVAEKKKQYASVEIRGKLVRASGVWQVGINDLTWNLNFPDKDVQAAAEKNVGKAVIVTGKVVNVKPPPQFHMRQVMQPRQPQPWGGNPQPFPPQPQFYLVPVEVPVVISVASLKAATD